MSAENNLDSGSTNEFDALAGATSGETLSSIEASLKRIEREEKELDLEIKREKVSEIRARRSALLDTARQKAAAMRSYIEVLKARQRGCNHKKGGRGADAVIRGNGNDNNYCIIFHREPNGKYMALCSRCLKEWHAEHAEPTSDGKVIMVPATAGYDDVMNYSTDNTPSQSGTFLLEIDPKAIDRNHPELAQARF